LIGAFIAWWIVASLQIWDPIFVPSPQSVWDKLVLTSTTHDGTLGYAGYMVWDHLRISLTRIVSASAIAVVIGIPLGFAIGLVPVLKHALGPFITFLRQLPPLAYFSLLIIWFGIDDSPKLILLVIAAVPPIIVATVAGLESVNSDYVQAARSLGSSTFNVTRRVLLPSALPDIFTGIRLGFGVAYGSVVAAETVNGIPGIGGMIRDAQRYNQTDTVILGIVLLGLSGLALELLLKRLQDSATPWRGHS